MLGVAISTVAGRFRIALRAGVGCQTSVTASQISTAKSSSVPVKLSGLYWKIQSVSGRSSASCLMSSRTLDRDIDDAGAVELEDDPPLQRGGRVVEVHDRAPSAAQALESARDEVGARLGQNLDGDVLGNQAAFDQLAGEVEVGLGGGRKADLDLLEADLQQLLEHPHLARGVHGLDERLVAVAQVDAAPRGRARSASGWARCDRAG